MIAFQLLGPNRTWLPTQHRPDRAELRRRDDGCARLRAEAEAAIEALDRALARSRGGSTCGYCRAPIATTALGCRNCRRNYVTGARDYGIEHRAAGQRCGMCGGQYRTGDGACCLWSAGFEVRAAQRQFATVDGQLVEIEHRAGQIIDVR